MIQLVYYLLRIQNNEYLKEFLLLTQVKLNSGLIGKVINKLDPTEESDLNEINETIKVNMKLLEKNLINRHLYNEETN